MNRLSALCHCSFILLAVLFCSCNPEAKWETNDVIITMSPHTVSAAYIECSFSTNKDAYYMVACIPVEEGYNPLDHQKQFMTLALDSANMEYINWRYHLLKEGVSPIAPFASHALQYGNVDHFFTNLTPNTDYWVFAFVVNPETLKPVGKLYLQTLTTAETSIVDVHFEYRVRGFWDYIYPLDVSGVNINTSYPYVAATRDSLDIAAEGITPEEYFTNWVLDIIKYDLTNNLRYGVQVTENDGVDSYLRFEAGHTYYTAITGFDGECSDNVIYKFTWTGETYDHYFQPNEAQ